MASLIICTPGGASDNSYATKLQADAYFANGLRNDAWQNNWTTDDKERALIQATADIERQGGARLRQGSPARACFVGAPYDTSSTDNVPAQALHFPRTCDYQVVATVTTPVIPSDLLAAVCEQALWLLKQQDAPELLDRAALQSQGVKSIAIDGLSESYGVTSVPAGLAPLCWQYLRQYVITHRGVA